MSDTVIQSYVNYVGSWFFVSTINRFSSAAIISGCEYAETLVWEFDFKTKKTGKLLYQGECGKGLLKTHFAFCKQLVAQGFTDE